MVSGTGVSQKVWRSAASNEIPCQSMVRGGILGVPEHRDSINENSKRIFLEMRMINVHGSQQKRT